MKILHVCNNFTANLLYSNLFNEIKRHNYSQEIIAPIRRVEDQGKFKKNCSCAKIYYPLVVRNLWDRIFFRRKIRKTLNFVLKQVELADIDLIHAHTLFSDGAVAYQLFRLFGIPYMVAIRNTDINLFLKYMPFLRKFGLAILDAASRVVFISDSYRSHLDFYYQGWCHKRAGKLKTIMNGINPFWLKNRIKKPSKCDSKFKLIFSGDFNFNKNLHGVITALIELKRLGCCVELEAVGLGRPNEDSDYVKHLKGLCEGNLFIKFSPAVSQETLLAKFRESDIFVMPSFAETFGLVYAEALSQGLPLIYSKDQGFDGVFLNGVVGYSVSAGDVRDIISGIKNVMSDYNIMTENIARQPLEKMFGWHEISKSYSCEYRSILGIGELDQSE